jgi:hypothetical protein
LEDDIDLDANNVNDFAEEAIAAGVSGVMENLNQRKWKDNDLLVDLKSVDRIVARSFIEVRSAT